jgi:hypothetical protein
MLPWLTLGGWIVPQTTAYGAISCKTGLLNSANTELMNIAIYLRISVAHYSAGKIETPELHLREKAE